jgi:murein DD-endopeptidase MepM/ murein hydrolase activator NlpD
MSNYINLDKSGLARVLSIYARFDYTLVIKVFDALEKEDAEEVATEMVEKTTVGELSMFEMGVLLHLLFTMWGKPKNTERWKLDYRILSAIDLKGAMASEKREQDRKLKNAGGLLWPVETSGSALISCFGPRHYFSKRRGWVDDVHPGIDITQKIDTPVYAAAPGTVVLAGPIGGYGDNVIAIRHSTTLLTSYGHMNSKIVKLNDEVTGGQTIGTVGSQGISEGPHLHFNVTTGENPPAKKIYNGNANPLQSGLSIPAGVPNPKKCH